ncbi:MAG TPA: hypothetical protein VGZ29_06430 [Terriglobia bacterium]|nr:hypothetical protein [Terriglobia bacterium]
MKSNLSMKSLCGCVIFLAVVPVRGAAQNPAPQPAVAQAPSVCANQPMCAEGYDFAAMITDFRTSEVNGLKVIDTTVHFVNKTNRPLVLGYTDGSGMAIDDQGNRYGINGYAGPNAVRGIGKVVNNQIDPKFVLQPGQAGDALFELIWRPSGGAVGQTFEYDFTVREANALEGGQFTLGAEFPLRFMGLTNGVGARPAAGMGYAPAGGALTATPPAGGAYSAGGMTATPPAGSASPAAAVTYPNGGATAAGCPPSGGLTAVNQAAGNLPAGAQSSVSQAQSTIAGLRSMFGKKKAAAAAAAAGGNPCSPAATAAAPAAVPAAGPAPSPAYTAPTAAAVPATATTAAPAATGAPTAAATTPNAAMTPAQRAEAIRLARLQAQQKAAAQAEARRKAAAEAAAKKKQAATTSTTSTSN